MNLSAALVRADRVLANSGRLSDFVRAAWPHVEPSPYAHGWHIDYLCEHLEAVSRVEIRNLVINIPPGCMKSLLVGCFWPAWSWIKDPTLRWIAGCFDLSLVGRDGRKILALMQSPWFVERWGDLFAQKKPSAFQLELKAGGFRFASSPKGRGTGRHANIVVIDDPIKPRDATGRATVTRAALDDVHTWRSGVLASRQADPATHRRVLVMQRLSYEDPTAETLREPGAVHVCLPMGYERERACVTVLGPDPRSREGELLFPSRFDATSVEALCRDMGPSVAAAQLQQRPQVAGGGIFRRERWRFWGAGRAPCLCDSCFTAKRSLHDSGVDCVPLPEAGVDSQSWDLAFKSSEHSDFVAATAWRAIGGRYYLRAVLNQRMNFSATKVELMRWAIAWPCPPQNVLVEDAANGPAIAAEIPTVTLVKPLGGKVARANACEAIFACGNVFLPHPDGPHGAGVWDLMMQCEAFPASLHDDMVDSLTQGISWYRGNSTLDVLATLARI